MTCSHLDLHEVKQSIPGRNGDGSHARRNVDLHCTDPAREGPSLGDPLMDEEEKGTA